MASKVTRLWERPDSSELLSKVADALGISPAIVEKDYFVTEALRISRPTTSD